MTVAKEPQSHEDLPWWSYDGSSTYQVRVNVSYIFIVCTSYLGCARVFQFFQSFQRKSYSTIHKEIKELFWV